MGGCDELCEIGDGLLRGCDKLHEVGDGVMRRGVEMV